MNEVLKNIYARRSVRSFSQEQVPEEIIRELIRAGTYAPNGMNKQGLRFVVVSNKLKMNRYSDLAKRLSVEMIRKGQQGRADPSQAESVSQMIMTLSNPDFNIFYNAPALVLVFAHPMALTPNEDGALAAENMMLAANSYGIGSCWIGFARSLGVSPEFMKEAGVPMDHQLIAPLIFGYPKKGEMTAARRDQPQILNWIR